MMVIDQAPGNYTLTVQYNGNDIFQPTVVNVAYLIKQEDALATYTGTTYASTGSSNSSDATILLTATIEDINDANRGEIINASVNFINRDTGNPINPNPLSISLLSPTLGTVSYEWEVNIGNSDAEEYEVGIKVGDYYLRDNSTDNTIILVSKAVAERFITGGGYLTLCCSEGILAGDPGTKNNFGFNVKFNKKGTNLQGNIRTLFRRLESDGVVHTYRVKGNRMTSLVVDDNYAEFQGKANVQDVTDPLNPISVFGNGDFIVKMEDNGEPGAHVDEIVFTLYDRDGALIFTSSWDGTQPIQQEIDGGNIKVHDRNNNAIANVNVSQRNIFGNEIGNLSAEVFPNPAKDFLNIKVTGSEMDDLRLQIFNVTGKLILDSKEPSNNGDLINIKLPRDMNTGLYYILVSNMKLRVRIYCTKNNHIISIITGHGMRLYNLWE